MTDRYISLLATLAIVVLPLLVAGQPAIEWQKCYGGSALDVTRHIDQTSDGGFIFTGFTTSSNGDVFGFHGSFDAWLVKVDGTGEIQWQRSLGGSADDRGNAVQQTLDGGYILAGYTDSNNGDVSGVHGEQDMWVVKLDSVGEIQWQKCLGGTAAEMAFSIDQTADGGYVAAGYAESNNGDVSGIHGDADVWIVKLNGNGEIEWQKCLGGWGGDYSQHIEQTTDGGFLVVGYTFSNSADVSGNHGEEDIWVLKLNINGDIEWQKCLGGTDAERGISGQQTNDGGYIVAGRASSNDGDVIGNNGSGDMWAVKLDAGGALQWQKCMGGSSNDWGNSVVQTVDGGFIVAGHSSSNEGDVSGNHGGSDMWAVKLNGNGDLQWQKCMGGTEAEQSHALDLTMDGGVIVAGFTSSNNGDVSGNHGSNDMWLVKLAGEQVGLSEAGPMRFFFAPNPVIDLFTISFESQARPKHLTMLDPSGRIVHSRTVTDPTSNIVVDITDLDNGLYHILIDFADGSRALQRLVKA